MKGISVIICCYNSASRVPKTLEYLSKQIDLTDIQWEVVLVDNCSEDNTRNVAMETWHTFNKNDIELRVIEESRQGLFFARSKGVAESKYDILLFCDDDNWLEEKYLSRAYSFLEANPAAAAVGGQGFPRSDIKIPDWFENFSSFYACSQQGMNIEDITKSRGYLYGAGMVLRKKAWDSVSACVNVRLLVGRKGKSLSSGEDVELCFKLTLLGWELWYHPELKFFHYMSAERLTEKYLFKIASKISESGVYLNPYKYFLEKKEVTKIVWLKDVCFVLFRLLRSTCALALNKSIENRVIFSMHSGSIKSLAVQFLAYGNNYKRIKRHFESQHIARLKMYC